MPLDNPEVASTTRRTFLTRAALAGALVTVGTTGGPLAALLPAAGAQDADAGDALELDDGTFAEATLPLEMAAVQAYQAALDAGALGDEQPVALRFQGHHQTVVDFLTDLLDTGADAPVPDPTIVSGTVATLAKTSDKAEALKALAELEFMLSATHLFALGGLVEPSTAKAVAQVLATEAQQGTYLGRVGGVPIADLTPSAATTAGATTTTGLAGAGGLPGSTGGSSSSTTSTTAATGSDGDATTTTAATEEGGN